MAAATYTTDLTTLTTSDTSTGFSEPVGSAAGGPPSAENDYFIQGTQCVSKTFNATGVGGMAYDNGAGVTIPTDGAVYTWVYFAAPNALNTKVNGGMQILIGSATTNYYRFYVAGSNTYTYGGWVCYPVDPGQTASGTQGTPTTTRQVFGYACNVVNAVAKGNPLAQDATRYGRGTLQVVDGDLANGYATFIGAAAQNDAVANRWGILSYVDGGYKYQGHLLLGTATTAVDFRDSNVSITIQNTEFVTANFNLVEVRNAASRVDWTGVSISALGTVSKGRFLVTDNADVNFDGNTFTDMDTFVFQSNSTILSTVFRRCGLVTQGGAVMTSCLFDKPSGTTGLLVSSPANLSSVTYSTFVSDGTGHGIEITGTAADCTLSGTTFTGYASTNGSTGNEAIFVNIATGSMTINITNDGTVPSIRTAGATVTVVNAKTFQVTNIVDGTEIRIYRQSDMIELAGAETVGASPSGLNNVTVDADPDNAGRYRVTYVYGYTSDTPVYVVAHHLSYQYLRQSVTLKATDGSLQIAQIVDRQYSNPV